MAGELAGPLAVATRWIGDYSSARVTYAHVLEAVPDGNGTSAALMQLRLVSNEPCRQAANESCR